MIVSGVITYLEKKDGKIVYIEVKIGRVLAVCFDSPYLENTPERYYIDSNIKNGLNFAFFDSLNFFFQNLLKQDIIGYIRKHDVSWFNLRKLLIIT